MRNAILAVLLVSLTAAAADVTGTWTGSVKLPDQEVPAYFTLKQQGSTVTGSVGGSADDQRPIGSGKIENDQLTLEVPTGNGSFKVSLKLQPDGNTLNGEVQREREGQTMKAPVELKRSSK